jgi:hypothetical protein
VRRLVVALVLTLAWATTAHAQSTVEGGGSFNDAPVVKPGRYTDTLRGTATLFYAIEVKRGQKLTATATVTGSTDTSYRIELQIYSPLREPDPLDGQASETFVSSDDSIALNVSGQTVGETGVSSDEYYQVSGTYYVSLAANSTDTRFNPPQFDTQLQFDVTGEVQPEPTAAPQPDRPDEQAPAPPVAADVHSGHGELGEVIVLALSLGALLGFAAVRLGRLRSEP